jgi:PleD family two-component response regulator
LTIMRGGPAILPRATANEQLAILLPDVCPSAALDMAEAIRHEIFEQTILHLGALVGRVVTASFGVATIVPENANAKLALVEVVGYGLNRAKRGGGNCVFATGSDVISNEK